MSTTPSQFRQATTDIDTDEAYWAWVEDYEARGINEGWLVSCRMGCGRLVETEDSTPVSCCYHDCF